MSDSSSDDERINDIILDEPIFYILTQFLETKDGKNITTVLADLTNELKLLRLAVEASSSAKSAPSCVSRSSQVSASGTE